MTLPFRRRHHDQESTHERARALLSSGLVEPTAEADAGWLAAHLDTCPECRRDRDGFESDHGLFAALRERTPEPPRDLWARTAAAIERERRSGRRGSTGTARGSRRSWRMLPLGTVASALIVTVVVGASLLQLPGRPDASAGTSGAVTPEAQPTPLSVIADPVGWIRPAANGRWELVFSEVAEVCPRSRHTCRALGEDDPVRPIDLGSTPTGVTISPDEAHLVVESSGDGTEPGKVFVVPLPAAPSDTPAPATDEPDGPSPATSAPIDEPTPVPPESPTVTPTETPGTTPLGAIEIASGVNLVGDAAYSPDGAWLAFSARPADGSTGPDLYLWHVGDATSVPVTTDHSTYFSTWLGNQVIASRIEAAPGAGPTASTDPASGAASSDVPSSPVALIEAHPMSFLLDPATLLETPFSQPDAWLPVVDASEQFVAYWSGTLVATQDVAGWALGTGSLALDHWIGPGDAPVASDADAPVIGPAGTPTPIDVGMIGTFHAMFDPDGARLAIWAGDEPGAAIGRLFLLVLDAETGTIDAGTAPLAGVPALRRFSINLGRLAWVSPAGQDGQESAVQVLGWRGRDFGEVKTIPGRDLFIVR